jgi:phospholipase A1
MKTETHQTAVRLLWTPLFVAIGGVGGVGTVLAQSSAPTLAQCRSIVANMERLACYDELSARPGDASNASGSSASADVVAPATLAATRTDGAGATSDVKKLSMIDSAWGFDPASEKYSLSLYRSNYLLFGRYTNDVNKAPYAPLFAAAGKSAENIDSTESEFQLSFKGRFWASDDRRFGLWGAYTQQSQWQVYNGDLSSPFRETNYMPEVFMSYGPDADLGGGFRWKLLNAGFNHQSNGRTDILSRSWNRLFAEFGVERENLALSTTLWYRLKESNGTDDNPDITDYYGYLKVAALYRWRGNSFAAEARGNLSTGKGAVQVGWFTPRLLGPIRGYVQVFSGYGETMIDYNWKQTTVGIGIAVSDGL